MTRPSPRARARTDVHDRLLSARLEPGDRVGLPTLARKLGVSVTPVREACTQLSHSGLLGYAPNRGFWVADLSAAEARVLYHTVVALEAEAVRQVGPEGFDTDELRQLNAAFAAAPTAELRYRRDMDFHAALTVYYAETAVAGLLEDLKVRIYLYERAYLAELAHVEASVALHDTIIDALAERDLPTVLVALRQNWLNIDPVLSAAGLLESDDSPT